MSEQDSKEHNKESLTKSYSFIAAQKPILIENTSVLNPTKTDIELLKALQECANLAIKGSETVDINVHELFSLDKVKSLKIVPFVWGNINSSIRKLIKSKVCYPYAYIAGEDYIVVTRIVLIQPASGDESNDIRRYRNGCFLHSIPMINRIIEKKSKRSFYFQSHNPGDLLLKEEKSTVKFFPYTMALEEYFRYLINRGFQLDKNSSFKPFPLKDFEKDLLLYLGKHHQVMEILPDYHLVLDSKFSIDKNGEYLLLPDLLFHYFAESSALEKVAIPVIKREATERNWIQMLEKIQRFETLKKEITYDSEKGTKRVDSIIKIVQSLSRAHLDEMFPDELTEAILQSLEIISSIKTKLPSLVARKKEASYQVLIENINKAIYKNSTNIDTNIHDIKGLNITPVNIKEEVSQIIENENEEEAKKYQKRLLAELGSQFAYYKDIKKSHSYIVFFVDHRYLLAVISNLYAQSQTNKNAAPYLEKAIKISSSLGMKQNLELNSKLNKEQIDFFQKDIDNISQKIKEKKSKFPWRTLLGIIATSILYILILYQALSLWPIIVLIVPLLVLFLVKRFKSKAKQALIDRMKEQFRAFQKKPEKTPERPQEKEKNAEDIALNKFEKRREEFQQEVNKFSEPTGQNTEATLKSKKTRDDGEKTFFVKDILDSIKDLISILDHYWSGILENPQAKNIYPPDMKKLAMLLGVAPAKLITYIRLNKKNFQKEIQSIESKSSDKVYFISSKFYLERKPRIKDFYKEVYDLEINQKDEVNENRLDLAHQMIGFFSKKEL